MKDYLLMTPGPTEIRENVRKAMGEKITNPDLDMDFYDFYKDITLKLKKIMNTENDVILMSGEAIMGLEASCASLIEKGDKVLCIHNGVFGKGFGDFAKMYGGQVVYYQGDYRGGLNLEDLKAFLKDREDIKIATLVHCETPSGITNPIGEICRFLHDKNILTVVDAVSAVGGEIVEVDKWQIDILIGGSQKCISAPPGLTFLSISEGAYRKMKSRNEEIQGFYLNLLIWEGWYEKKSFPYTQSISDLYGFNKAIDNLLDDKNYLDKHRRMGEAVRKSFIGAGLKLYSRNSYSNTVTTVLLPEGLSFKDIFDEMKENHRILLGGGFDFLENKIFRVGHMGEICSEEKIYTTLKALDQVLRNNNVDLKEKLHIIFTNMVS